MASKRDKIRLISSANTGHFYTTDKNKKNTPAKMEVKKYDPVVRKHVIYKEGKIKWRTGAFAHSAIAFASASSPRRRGSSALNTKPAQAGFVLSGTRNQTKHHRSPSGCPF